MFACYRQQTHLFWVANKSHCFQYGKLVNSFLEGIIERDFYLKKKEELILKKGYLEEQAKQFGDKAIIWIEPMISVAESPT